MKTVLPPMPSFGSAAPAIRGLPATTQNAKPVAGGAQSLAANSQADSLYFGQKDNQEKYKAYVNFFYLLGWVGLAGWFGGFCCVLYAVLSGFSSELSIARRGIPIGCLEVGASDQNIPSICQDGDERSRRYESVMELGIYVVAFSTALLGVSAMRGDRYKEKLAEEYRKKADQLATETKDEWVRAQDFEKKLAVLRDAWKKSYSPEWPGIDHRQFEDYLHNRIEALPIESSKDLQEALTFTHELNNPKLMRRLALEHSKLATPEIMLLMLDAKLND